MKEHRYYSPLARRIGIYVILVSACITLFTSGLQIYSEYKRDVDGVHARLDQLKITQIPNIASRVWVLDLYELKRTLNSLLDLESIQYIEVYDDNALLMAVGKDVAEKALVVQHRLTYEHNSKLNDIGYVVIKASLDQIYSLVINRAMLIVFSNAIKTFIVAGFVFFIFYQLVGRHLGKISRFTQSTNLLHSTEKLHLDRNTNNTESDELDMVVNSIHAMQNELRQQFEAISHQKTYLSLTLDSIGDGVITTDTNGYVKSMNKVAEKLTGWSIDESRNLPIANVFQIINRETFEPIPNLTKILIHARNHSLVENDSVLFSRDGNEFHISYKATPIKDVDQNLLGVVLIFHDISERFKLLEDLAKSKRDMQAIMDNSPAVIYIKDINGKYLFINRRYEILFNTTREQTIGKTDYELFDKNVADVLKRNDDNVKRAGHALELEESIPHANSEIHTYISNKFPLLDENGIIYAVCGISTDITDRKTQENNLRRAQKMDALGKLTSGIAHDYNNMLGIILGYAQLLESSLTDKPTLQKYATEIRHAGDRGTKLTKKLLDFSSQDISDAANVDINQIIGGEQNMLEKTLTSRIKLHLELEDTLWITHLDSGELEDAIVNMCINAMHAIEGNGEIKIRSANKILSEKEADRLQIKPGEYVLLSITDNGCGMDEATQERIFDPFFSTKGAKGTGLGLSQVYGFMERCSGTIDVSSTPGIGTRFDLYFPRSYTATQDRVSEEDTELKKVVAGHETVLVVDDEPSLVNLVNEGLALHGYKVLTANNGQEALDILNNQSVDLLISDIIMPKLDGTQLAVEVQRKYPHIKIQMVSGYADNKLNNSIDGALAKQILYKPFSMEELISRVHALLDDKREQSKVTGCTILVMDDIEDVRELFRINLTKLGCKVITARDGEEAIEIYKNSLNGRDRIDVVILDISIPGGLGGKEVAAELRKLDKNVKLILSSGYVDNPTQSIFERFQVDGVLEKNFNRSKLKQVLENILN